MTGFTQLLVNLESMTSKPNAGGGSEYRVTWKVEDGLPSHETLTANSNYTAMIALGYGIPESNARALPGSVGQKQRASSHTKEERVDALVAGFMVKLLGPRKANNESTTEALRRLLEGHCRRERECLYKEA